jgi:hypothetical protein
MEKIAKLNLIKQDFGLEELLFKMKNNDIKIKSVNDTLLDWENISPCFSFSYNDFSIKGGDIEKKLLLSELSLSKSLYFDLGFDEKVVKIDTNLFIKNWEYVVHYGGSMGRLVISEDFSYIIEFTDDSNYTCYSNFRILGDLIKVV